MRLLILAALLLAGRGDEGAATPPPEPADWGISFSARTPYAAAGSALDIRDTDTSGWYSNDRIG